MRTWENEFIHLIQDMSTLTPGEMDYDDLILLRTYVGRELSTRLEKQRALEIAQGDADESTYRR